jgi:phosphoribosylglycinamide formyltransferase-1
MRASNAALPLAVLISGRGSNMLAIAQACAQGRIGARVVSVIADREDAPGIQAARAQGLATQVVSGSGIPKAQFEAQLAQALDESAAELVALAGFMRILSPGFVEPRVGRLLNIHPSLLPRYRGLDTHRRALAAGDGEHGASVHYVTAELDAGPLICQGRLSVTAGQTEAELSARVHRLEHRIYPMVIGLIAAGRLRLTGAQVLLDESVLETPLQVSETGDADGAPI